MRVVHDGVMSASVCSICGVSASSTSGARDGRGSFVCQGCIEHARKVIIARQAAKARAAHEEKTQKLVEEAEQDNRWVLDLRTDDALADAAHQCRNCGRFMELDSVGCYSCGYGTSGQMTPAGHLPGRWRFFSGLSTVVSGARTSSSLFPWLDQRAAFWTQRGLLLALCGVVIAGAFVPWLWTSAMVILAVLTLVIAGAVLFAAYSISMKAAAAQTLLVVAGATAALWLVGEGDQPRRWILTGVLGASALAMTFFVATRVRDRFVTGLWWSVVLAWLVTIGIMAYRAYVKP